MTKTQIRLELDYTDACNSYRSYAQIEGRLTDEERREKARLAERCDRLWIALQKERNRPC